VRYCSAENLKVMALPALFEVRWTEFLYNLLNAVLVSWHALVLHKQASSDKEARGFLSFLLDHDKLLLLCFLADILAVFSRYERQMQSNDVPILDFNRLTCFLKTRLLAMEEKHLPGGWVKAMQDSITQECDGAMLMKGMKLTSRTRQLKEHHLYVSDKRDVKAVCHEVLHYLVEYLSQRLDIDAELVSICKPFVQLQPQVNLEMVH